MSFLSRSFNRVSQQTKELIHRSNDHHIRLAVTGLSGAGKTAFITGLVNQLLNTGDSVNQLPLWQVTHHNRLIGIKRQMQPDMSIASFDYQNALQQLHADKPTWPASTRNISELRLAIKYQPQQGMLAKFTESSTLYVDIVDYPGEWLLDLPMLQLTYQQWCEQQFSRQIIWQSSPYYQAYADALTTLDLNADADEQVLDAIAKLYQQLLQDLVLKQGFYYAQPGRMLLPGDLEGAPVLAFFPLALSNEQHRQYQQANKNSYYQILNKRYNAYCEQVITPFYRDYFAKFDRQVVLVDCLTALNRGHQQFNDMSFALNQILQSFQFGQSSWFKRLFSPRIDRLLFAASKVDHVSRDQQSSLVKLLSSILQPSRKHARFDGCHVETMAISAIKATEHGIVKQDGQHVEVIIGARLNDGAATTLFPGQVPDEVPNASFWHQQGFHFQAFAPKKYESNQAFEHIRLDHLLQYLLGDKLL